MEKMITSIIITTKNEERHIANCLKSIDRQTYLHDKIEVIIVDNNSTGRTVELTRGYSDEVYDLDPNRAARLNFRVNISNGECIMFSDVDIILGKDVVAKCVKRCLCSIKENLVALYI